MIIKKFQGKTEEEAVGKARQELGNGTVIMNVKEIRPKGLFKSMKSSTYEVTAAIEENDDRIASKSPVQAKQPVPAKSPVTVQKPGSINMLADEPIMIPPMTEDVYAGVPYQESISRKSIYQEPMRREGMYQEPLPKEAVPRESISREGMSREGMSRESVFREGMSRESISRENTYKENVYSDGRHDSIENNLEEKIENLQSLIEKKLVPKEEKKSIPKEQPADENVKFLKMIYGILLENEVDEKYVNQMIDEVEKVMRNGLGVDQILSSIYQKMILKFGPSQPIELTESRPKIVFFVGPTGVGKTTTIAKIASRFKVEKGKKVALMTADTYRIAAADQLNTYANILGTPLNIVYSVDELLDSIEQMSDFDLILVDTAGFSHKNTEQRNDIRKLIDSVGSQYEKEVYLVLSATTKYRDLMDIVDVYKENFQFKIIFTKLDETSCYGNLLNIKLYAGTDLSYATYGQNVPEDIEVFDTQKIVKLLLGGK